ncbi:mobile element protein [Jejuia pallidilutea]|nr:mobile element protein [Jejuia pallidilutea]
MAALSSIRIKGEIQDFYHRKIKEGKNKMSILNAIRNKIVLRVFACVKNNRMYQKNYEYLLG